MKQYWFFSWLSTVWAFVKTLGKILGIFYRFSRMQQPMITIFGGTNLALENPYSKQAFDIAALAIEHGFSIITGGGPGIMEAAHCGAVSNDIKNAKKVTFGIGVEGVDRAYKNPCAEVVNISNLFIRRWLLTDFSVGFIIFPGGIGTAAELFALLDEMKLQKLPIYPVVLIGKAYWQPLLDWYFNEGIKSGYIPAQYADLFIVTDDLNEAFKIIHKQCSH